MKRKNEVKFRHRFITKLARVILYPYIKIRYKFKYKFNRKLKKAGPFLVLSNHTVAWDPILMSYSFPFPLYFIATEQIFNLGFLSKLLVYAVNPISKSKSSSDMVAIRKARRIVAEGGSIAVYPEGNVTYDGGPVTINKNIIKLIKLLGIPIIIYNTCGLYLSDPRWSLKPRKGKTAGKIKRIIEVEEYKNLSDNDLYDLILKELGVNAYYQQANNIVNYKGKNLALGLERLIFIDLITDEPFVTYSKGNVLRSKTSDFELTYTETGYLLFKDSYYTLVDLNKKVIESYLRYYLKTSKELLYEEDVNLELTTNNKKINKGLSKIKLYKNKIVIDNNGEGKTFDYESITSIAIQGKRKVIINSDQTYLVTLNDYSSPYKYLLTYQFYKKEESLNDENIEFYQFGL